LEWSEGNQAAQERLLPLIYDELRRLAGYQLQRERRAHTLQATALVHEVYLRLVDQERVQWKNRVHFLAIAGQMMRRVLVDYARSQQRLKRGAGYHRITLVDSLRAPAGRAVDLEALDDCLNDLASTDPQQARIVELRYFAGLSIEETAEALSISTATVKRDWAVARAWLRREMTGHQAASRRRSSRS
jgi:RNA polymerase sigma factor (TIGR02999 family)